MAIITKAEDVPGHRPSSTDILLPPTKSVQTIPTEEQFLDKIDNVPSVPEPNTKCKSNCIFRNFNGRQRIFLVVFSIANFFSAAIFSLTAPLYPSEAETKNATASEYGSVIGIFALAAFISSPIFGKYLFRIGPKLVFTQSMFIGGVATILFGCLDALNDHVGFLVGSFIIRVVSALGDAAFVTASFALIASEFPGYVATTFGFLETFFGMGLIFGPTIGGLLFQVGGFVLPFASLGGCLVVVSLLACLVIPKEQELFKESSFLPLNKLKADHFAALKVPRIWLAGVSIMACSMTINFLSATLEPHIRQFNLTPVTTGAVFMIFGGMYAISLPILGWMCDRVLKPRALALVGALLIATGFLFIGPAPFLPIPTTLWLTCVGLVIYGVGLGAGMVSSFIMALQAAIGHGFVDNIQTYGVVSSLWNSFFALGNFIGPSIGGVLLDNVGFRWSTVFILGVQTAIIALLVISLSRRSVNDASLKTSESEPLLTPDLTEREPNTASHSSYGSNSTP
ncbi:unnamed protein product [Allacma fusca]|uniref:Major facilitator superfamily (MFS) profile domain-containing protein n=1 Tax=Allacma fusca TaxID=39272 RepID=A0A8J2LKJ7_9HEXA|nr:unnamed protein product [Allacma fusca]